MGLAETFLEILGANINRCNDCGLKFEEPKVEREPHGEDLAWCPGCGSGDWMEVNLNAEDEEELE